MRLTTHTQAGICNLQIAGMKLDCLTYLIDIELYNDLAAELFTPQPGVNIDVVPPGENVRGQSVCFRIHLVECS